MKLMIREIGWMNLTCLISSIATFRKADHIFTNLKMMTIECIRLGLVDCGICAVDGSLPSPPLRMLQLAPSRALDLSKRGLREIPAELSQVASSLLSLFLASNHLTSLSLPPLPRLSELHLADNLLDSRTVQLAPLPHALRVLDLSKNRLLLFPPSLLSLSQLRLLLLSNQQLSSLPPQLSALSQLEVLDASFNEISHALILNPPGLPILRRLLLRGNSLRAVSLDGERLPSLTELDLSDNALDHFPPTLGSLSELKTLSLSNNRLRKLVSEETAPCRRMWVASHGLHQLTQLTQLSLAQNQLIELPLGLQQLAQLLHLDLRCNPLSPEALELASSHCKRVGARLRSTSLPRLYPGLILGDESSAWHKPTLLHARVTHVVSFSSSPPSGVALTRLQAKLPMEVALLGLCDAKGGYTLPLLTAEGLRKAFHAQALRCHPDKQQQSERAASSLRFAELKAAYTRLCRCEQSTIAFVSRPSARHFLTLFALSSLPTSIPPRLMIVPPPHCPFPHSPSLDNHATFDQYQCVPRADGCTSSRGVCQCSLPSATTSSSSCRSNPQGRGHLLLKPQSTRRKRGMRRLARRHASCLAYLSSRRPLQELEMPQRPSHVR